MVMPWSVDIKIALCDGGIRDDGEKPTVLDLVEAR